MALKVRDIAAFMETWAPLSYAESYDNPGLTMGRCDREVRKIMLSIDASVEVAEQCVKGGCDFLLTHHPLLFHPVKKIVEDGSVTQALLTLAENKIALYAAHTNLDSAPGGNIDRACELLGLKNIQAVGEEGEIACLRIGEVDAISMEELLLMIRNNWKITDLHVTKVSGAPIGKVGVVTGSGMDMYKLAAAHGCDVFITGDISYHRAVEARALGLSLIDATHFATDKLSLSWIREELIKYAASKGESLEVVIADEEDPMKKTDPGYYL